MNCSICDEKYNKAKRAKICCLYCQFEACRECSQKYIIDQTIGKCMNTTCNKEWSRKFMVSVFTNVFMVTKWQKVREKALYDKERALLPSTQGIIEEQMKKEKVLGEINDVDKLINELYRKKISLQNKYRTFDTKNVERKTFVRACPVENCRGFLSTQWKCGLCNIWTCPDCNIIKGENRDVEHECKPDDLATAKLIASDTKPCPKCATGIFKIDGCDQMWCTQCQTPFSWKTGRIETTIHNPHYYEWLRRQNLETPRNPDDIICGRELTHHSFRPFQRDLRNICQNINACELVKMRELETKLSGILESVLHLRHVQMPSYRIDQIENNLNWRISFMRGFISEEVFIRNIQRDDKKTEKYREIYEVLNLLVQTVTDIMYRIFARTSEINESESNTKHLVIFDILPIVDEIQQIQEYVNECLDEISVTYKCVKYKVDLYILENANRNALRTRNVLQRA